MEYPTKHLQMTVHAQYSTHCTFIFNMNCLLINCFLCSRFIKAVLKTTIRHQHCKFRTVNKRIIFNVPAKCSDLKKDISYDLTKKIQYGADFDPEGNFEFQIWNQ